MKDVCELGMTADRTVRVLINESSARPRCALTTRRRSAEAERQNKAATQRTASASLRDEPRFLAETSAQASPRRCQLTDRLMDGMGGDVRGAAAAGLLTAAPLLVPLLSAAMQSTAKDRDEQRRMGGRELVLQKSSTKEEQC